MYFCFPDDPWQATLSPVLIVLICVVIVLILVVVAIIIIVKARGRTDSEKGQVYQCLKVCKCLYEHQLYARRISLCLCDLRSVDGLTRLCPLMAKLSNFCRRRCLIWDRDHSTENTHNGISSLSQKTPD
ncbi:hypothetical protein CDAR_289231 [Caerostris darwini]|uniref:Uncharacterized protein n=1 Tax=Caerostris darwini TaxID=1538125 RepID=A0AAV4PFE6_9ARAC|nr:hypothetical protein CDAR_289231 [Caerostris darwini]